MKITEVNIKDLKPYENNPRNNEQAVDKVANSIAEFGFKNPVIIDKNNIIVCGHTRYLAAKKLNMDKIPCIIAEDLTEEQVKAFRLADNKTSEFASWDYDLLEAELEKIDIDMEPFGFNDIEALEINDMDLTENKYAANSKSGSLSNKFIVPPFSIFNTRMGYWQERKRAWKSLGIKSEIGRDDSLLGQGLKDLAVATNSNLTGTSIFDPVLCEIIYNWFCTENGKVYDCFAGGSVRGIVASYLGYEYIGIDLSERQIDANRKNAKKIGVTPQWFCDDSLNADKYLDDSSVDLVFSCPPYADLEQYSDDPRDISTMEYEDFKKVYGEIIKTALRKLKANRFAVFVVGDVRDKNGFYRDFISDTKHLFIENGASLYNEIILVEQIATGALRANNVFPSYRKVVKCHQNVLVFFKGDPKTIKNNYPDVEVADLFETEKNGEII